MSSSPMFRRTFAAALCAGLAATGGCATYDDSRAHQACKDSDLVKDLPPQMAARESRCNEGLQIWNRDDSKGSAAPLDFSGRNKDG